MKQWQKGDKAWVLYRYTGSGAVPVEVVLNEKPNRRGYVGVSVPSMFGGGTFNCLVRADMQLFQTKEEAERVNAEEPDYEPTPQ